MNAFLVIGIGLILGILLRRSNKLPDNTAEVLNLYIIWVALPAVILQQLPKLQFSADALYPALFAWVLLLISVALVLLIAKLMRWSRDVTCVLLLLVPLGNTSFLGIPLTKALLGTDALPYVILYDQLGSFLALATYGSFVIAWSSGRALNVSDLIKKIISFPPFIALCFGVILRFVPNLQVIQGPLSAFAETLVPVVMVAVGFQWRFRLDRENGFPFTVSLALKLFVMPLLAWFGFWWLEVEAIIEHAVVLEAAMAPMISAGALAIAEKRAPELAASIVGYGLLFGLFTVPFWWWVITR